MLCMFPTKTEIPLVYVIFEDFLSHTVWNIRDQVQNLRPQLFDHIGFHTVISPLIKYTYTQLYLPRGFAKNQVVMANMPKTIEAP